MDAAPQSVPTEPAGPRLATLERALAERERLRALGRVVVLTNGVFDLLHPGHRHLLAEARRQGDALFVALNADASVRALKGPERPAQDLATRAAALGALPVVDLVFAFETPRLDAEIRTLRPDVYVKAGYTLDTLDPSERRALEDCRARLVLLERIPGHSTSDTIARGKID